MIKLNKIFLDDWLVFEGQQEVSFQTTTNANVITIFGENQAGKTSFLNAFRFALYGEVRDRRGNLVDTKNLINRRSLRSGKKEFGVEVQFEDDGSHLTIQRKGTSESPETTLIVRQDGKSVSLDMAEKLISDLIPKQLANFFLFDGEHLSEYEALTDASAEAGAKKALRAKIEENLGIPVLTTGRELLRKSKMKISKQLSTRTKKSDGFNSSLLQQVIEKKEACERAIEEKEKEEEKLASELTSLEEGIERHQEIAKLKSQLENVNRNIHREKESRDKTFENLKLLNDKCTFYFLHILHEQVVAKTRDKQDELSQQEKIARTAVATMGILEASLENKVCETCKQPLHDEADLSLKIADLSIEASKLQQINVELDAIKQRLSWGKSLDGANEIKGKALAYAEQLSGHYRQLGAFESEKNGIRDDLSGSDSDESDQIARHYAQTVAAHEQTVSFIENQRQELDGLQANYDKFYKQFEKERGIEDDLSRRMNLTTLLLEAFETSVDKYRESRRSDIEKRANESFSQMTTLSDYDRLVINEDFGLELFVNDAKDYVSAGGSQIVALSLIEAINHLGRKKGPLLMDTPFGRLDKSHRKNILSYLPTAVSQLITFTHSGEMGEEDNFLESSIVACRYRIKSIKSQSSVIEKIS